MSSTLKTCIAALILLHASALAANEHLFYLRTNAESFEKLKQHIDSLQYLGFNTHFIFPKTNELIVTRCPPLAVPSLRQTQVT